MLLDGNSATIKNIQAKICIKKEWAELCVHTRCDAFCFDKKIPYEYLEQFSKNPLPKLKIRKKQNNKASEYILDYETCFIQGVFNYINYSPMEAWFFCKYLEQEGIQHYVFFDGGSEENPERNFVIWLPDHANFN